MKEAGEASGSGDAEEKKGEPHSAYVNYLSAVLIFFLCRIQAVLLYVSSVIL